jgi:lipopolysaccharide export system permease protein
MKKLDKYILGKYFSTFFFCLLLLTAIVVVVDISEKTDDFSKSGLSVAQLIRDYYFGFVPRIVAMLFPLFIFISVIFFTSKMAGRSEIVAILSSGVSYKRFLLPFFVGGLFFTSLLWLGYQYAIPLANRKWSQFEKKYIDVNSAPTANSTTYKQNIYFRIDPQTYASIKGYDTISKSGSNFSLHRFANNKMIYNMRAVNFRWDTAGKKWSFYNVLERTISDSTEQNNYYPSKEITLNIRPVDLRKDTYLKDEMTTKELVEFIELEKMRGSELLSTLQVERYNRDAIPVSVVILTLIGAILASRKTRGGSGFHLAVGVLISMAYILFSRFSVVFATKSNFSPLLAAWTPNIMFLVLVAYLYRIAPK